MVEKFNADLALDKTIAVMATEKTLTAAKDAFDRLLARGYRNVCVVLEPENGSTEPAKAALACSDAVYEL